MSSNNTVSTASNNTAAASNNVAAPAAANNAAFNNANTPASSPASAPEAPKNTKVSEMVNKGKEMVKNNSTIIITVVIYLVIMTAYFLSKTFIRNTYEKLNKYENYMMLTDKFLKEKMNFL